MALEEMRFWSSLEASGGEQSTATGNSLVKDWGKGIGMTFTRLLTRDSWGMRNLPNRCEKERKKQRITIP